MDLQPIQFVRQGKLNEVKIMGRLELAVIMRQTGWRVNPNKPIIHSFFFFLRLIKVVGFFCLFISTVTCPMNEILTASTGVIMSQSPGSGFPHFESCSWVVKVEPGYNITFTIEHFQTSRQFDELEIFDGEPTITVPAERRALPATTCDCFVPFASFCFNWRVDW